MAKAPKSLTSLFERQNVSSNLSAYQKKTAEFRKIHQLLTELLGDTIAQNLIVRNFNDCILTLETNSAAIATRFKMSHSQILSEIRKQINPATVTIDVKVSPKSSLITNPESLLQPKVVTAKNIPDGFSDSLNSIAERCDDKLKQSLQRLASTAENKRRR